LRPGRLLWWAMLLVLLPAAAYTLYLDWRVRDEFEGRRFSLPARIYARPLELHAGLRLPAAALEQELRDLGYRASPLDAEWGWYTRNGDSFDIAVRAFMFWDGPQPARRLRVSVDGGTVAALRDAQGANLDLARLEPLLIGGIYPANNEDRVLVRLNDVPKHLVDALIAIEDRKYFSHAGFDPRAIARALYSMVSGKGIQGGSTLTQQLVKNFFLTRERTLSRKLTELVMAVLLEMHFDKQEILETYLNEIYLGQDRDRAVHGIGLAAQHYFGKPIQDVSVAEGALLVALVKGPAVYDPRRHPERALERRNLVLREMRELGSLDVAQYSRARAEKLLVNPGPGRGTSPHPAFLQLVHTQLRRDYADADLRSEGLRIFTTLDPRAQRAAERAVAGRLAQFDRDKRFGDAGLEGAAVVTDPQSGEVQALVGGRDPRYRGFNRALDAARPVGSLLKPAIYLTALAEPSRYTLVTPLDDGPFVWSSRGAPDWIPENYDKEYHGEVPLRMALALSYNAASARLGTTLGVQRVLDNVKRLGVERPVQPFASSLLGAVSFSPLEVAQMYQTIASGGFRTPLRAIREVTTQEGQPLKRYPLAVEQAFAAEPIYLLTFAMQDVVREGTARSLRNWLPPETAVAAKTGTTDEQRDAWFAGFTGGRLGIVWVGYDDNRAAQLTGAGAALPIWGEMMAALDPEPLAVPRPDGVELVSIDPANGLRGGLLCPGTIEVPFIKGSAPEARSPCTGAIDSAIQAVEPALGRAKSWLDRLLGR